MEIRFLTPDDADAYWKLRLEALQGDPEAFSSSAEEHQSVSLHEIRARLGSSEGDSFVAGAFEVIASMFKDEPKVSDAFRSGRGVGTSRLRAAVRPRSRRSDSSARDIPCKGVVG